MVISLGAGPKFIEFLRRNEFGQQIREEGPQGHVVKQGTPTMGGLARAYLDGARGVPVTRYAPTVEQGLAAVREVLEPGDYVLVKGSRAMGLEVIGEAVAIVPVAR